MRTLLLSALILTPLVSFAAPGLPHQVYGTATNTSENTLIKAFVNGVEVGSTRTNTDAAFGVTPNLFLLGDPNGTYAGSEVTFTIDGTQASQTITFANGGLTELTLSVEASTSSGGGGGGRTRTASADLNGDGKIDLLDFNILMARWGTSGGDLNDDDKTDLGDFNYLLANWT